MSTSVLLRALFWLVVIPVAFECTIRIDDRIRYRVPFTSRAASVEDLQVDDSLGHHGRPNSAYRQFRINNWGFRGPDVASAQLESSAVIIAAGSSESFGLYETAGHEWPALLADTLASTCRSAPPVVLNAAIAGMALPTARVDFSRRLTRLRPKVVIYYPQPAQYLFDNVPGPPAESRRTAESLPAYRWRAYERARASLKSMIPEIVLDALRARELAEWRAQGPTTFSALPIERLDAFEAELRAYARDVSHAGTRLVIILPQHRFSDTTVTSERYWLRAWERQTPRATGPVLLRFYAAANERIRRMASELGVPVVSPALPTDSSRARFFADPVHFSNLGAAAISAAVAHTVDSLLACTNQSS